MIFGIDLFQQSELHPSLGQHPYWSVCGFGRKDLLSNQRSLSQLNESMHAHKCATLPSNA
eukprot:539840-Amphidinium_carterae.1